MDGMEYFYEKLDAAFEDATAHTGLSRNRIINLAGMDGPNFLKNRRDGRFPTEEQLRQLGECPQFPASYTDLLAWKLIDTYGFELVQSVAEAVALERSGKTRINPAPPTRAEAS